MVWYTVGMRLRELRTASVKNKRILVRVDYNVETVGGRLRDTTRLERTMPTIQWLLRHGATVILVTHRGRPHGRQAALSLRPLVRPLARLIGQPVSFFSWPLFSHDLTAAMAQLRSGQVVLLENIRFEAGEEDNSPRVAKRLASFCDLMVNDAFADSHRAHASIVGVAKFRRAYAGLLLLDEVSTLSLLLTKPKRPYVAILGGAKISTKLGLITALLKKADHVLLGGALANTILQAEGNAIGASMTEPGILASLRGVSSTNKKLEIPCDVVVATKRSAAVPRTVRAVGNIGRREIILDIGPDTVDLFGRVIAEAKTIVWNGPMGMYELRPFSRGTTALARRIARTSAMSVAGGGETIDAIKRTGSAQHFSFLSTGGGAMLEFLEGRTLPGVAAVRQR